MGTCVVRNFTKIKDLDRGGRREALKKNDTSTREKMRGMIAYFQIIIFANAN